MNVDVKHNGTIISSRIISYQREHRICTGIGTLDITFEGTYGTAIEPWDTIDIYENGSFQVRYYVSDVSHSVPAGTITAQCQDISKRLVDYFIPTAYTIDYPSTTRYWIEKFLDEAGINYDFQTSSQGNLLSNYTALGLQPAYDQIMLLLQLSGWYMYFDGNGVAIIGSLSVDLASTSGSVGFTDIIDIKKISNDKMLRNRALVWGEYNPITGYAFADVTRHTRWDYDNNDLRTMVVSNQNIPNKSSAYNIANILLKEFARITIEKHIVLEDARNYNLGAAIRVNSHVWRGKGLITTFGVNMDRNGLTTSIILDERCPRLFGFFNFGDWVYVGTFGDGVWRKHIKFDHTWYNFSTGLTDLNITDLHINNGIFGAVGHSGQMYYANSEEGPWYEIPTITGLMSSEEDDVTSSGTVTWVPFSGISARATIVDKTTNIVKFGVDTWSGLNTGDYFLTYSGMVTSSGVTSSGVTTSGDNRGWIVEYDPYTGTIYDAVSSGIYPISYSGNYDMRVLDLENDGVNDYVSVKTGGAVVIEHTSFGYNFGSHTTQVSTRTQDDNAKVSFNALSTFDAAGKSLYQTLTNGTHPISVFDNESIDEREILYYIYSGGRKIKRTTVIVSPSISSVTLTSPAESVAFVGTPTSIVKLSTDNYRVFLDRSYGTMGERHTYSYADWDAATNTLGSEITISTWDATIDPYHSSSAQLFSYQRVIIDDVAYVYSVQRVSSALPGEFDPDKAEKERNYLKIWAGKVDIKAGTFTDFGLVFYNEFRTGPNYGTGPQYVLAFGAGQPGIPLYAYQAGDHPALFMVQNETDLLSRESPYYNSWFIYSLDGLNFTMTKAQDGDVRADLFYSGIGNNQTGQLTGERFYYTAYDDSGNGKGVFYNGDTLQYLSKSSNQWYETYANIYPLFGAYDNYFIAKNGTSWYFCNPQTMSPQVLFSPPVGYTIVNPYGSTDTISPRYYWLANKPDSFNRVILKTTESAIMEETKPASGIQSNIGERAFISGNFFVQPGTSTAMLYLNNNVDVPDRAAGFLVLQRDGADFNLIRSAAKPIRIDISNSSPTLTVLDFENTFQSHFITENEVVTIIPVSGLIATKEVRDYRYTMLETTTSGTIVGSGAGAQSQILYVTESGVYHTDASAYSGGFIILDTISSGVAERIETTNYTYPGQYIFVTTSGDNPMFFQRDNETQLFTYYSGLPDSRATIIRVDDRV